MIASIMHVHVVSLLSVLSVYSYSELSIITITKVYTMCALYIRMTLL